MTSKKTTVRRELRDRQRAWLRAVVERSGLSASALARQVGVSEITLTRFLNRPDYPGVLSQPTVSMICEAANDPGPDAEGERAVVTTEGRELDLHGVTKSLKAARALIGNRSRGCLIYELLVGALEAAGYLPGDILVVDAVAAAKPGSVVCAMCGDQVIFRINRSQVLLGATYSPHAAPAPLFVDNANVKIVGPVVHSIRSP